MANTDSVAADGLVVRPSRASDGAFLQSLYQAARPDLQWIDGEQEVVEHVVAQQFRVQEQGLGERFPNAMHYVIEKLDTAIGALTPILARMKFVCCTWRSFPRLAARAMAARCCKVCSKPRNRFVAR